MLDETGEVGEGSEDVAHENSLGAVVLTEPGGAFEVAAGKASIARFSIGLATDAQFPGL